MANLVDVLDKKSKNNSLSRNGEKTEKYDNPIARLNTSKGKSKNSYASSDAVATGKQKASVLPKVE